MFYFWLYIRFSLFSTVMKKLFLLTLTCVFYQLATAQTIDKLDYQKLLQHYQAKQYSAATAYLQGIYKDSSDLSILKQLSYSRLMDGNYIAAEKDYLYLNTKTPDDPAILTALADINRRRNQHNLAIELYTAVVKIDTVNFHAYKQLALLNPDLQSPSRKAYLLKASTLNPYDTKVAIQMADSYFKDIQFNEAEGILNTALAADTGNTSLMQAKMPILMALKKYSEAIKTGKTLLRKYKAPPENLLYQMAICYREKKDHKTAVTYFQSAIKEGISSKTASYYGLLGESYESMKQNKEALEHYKKGLQFENNGSLYYNIALLYEDKLNDKKNAISYYTQYLNSIKDIEKQKRHIAFIKNKIEELKR